MENWLTTLGLEIPNEHTKQPLAGGGSEVTTQASGVPDTQGTYQLVFPTNVPPYWKEEIVKPVLLTQGTSQRGWVRSKT